MSRAMDLASALIFAGASALGTAALRRRFATLVASPPKAKRIPKEIAFGLGSPSAGAATKALPTKTDDLFWLRDDDRKDPAVLEHLARENAFTALKTGHLSGGVDRLYKEFRSRMQETDADVPHKYGAWLYYTRQVEGKSYPLHCRRPLASSVKADGTGLDLTVTPVPPAEEQCMLDVNAVAGSSRMCDVGTVDLAPTQDVLAYTVDFSGAEEYSVKFKRPEEPTGSHAFPDVLTDTSGDVCWGADAASLYYTTHDDAHRPYKVWRHVMGTPQSEDACIHTETDEKFWLGLARTRTDDFLIIESASKITAEVRVVPLTDRAVAAMATGGAAPELSSPVPVYVIQPRTHNVLYDVDHWRVPGDAAAGSGARDAFIICTNADGAKNFKLVAAPCVSGSTGSAHWRDVIPHDPARMLSGVNIFERFWSAGGREGGYKNVWVATAEQLAPHVFPSAAAPSGRSLPAFPLTSWTRLPPREGVYTMGTSGDNVEYGATTLRFFYSSPLCPTLTCAYTPGARGDAATAEGTPFPAGDVWHGAPITLLKRKAVPNVDTSKYAAVRVWAPSRDGRTRIPISVMWRPDAHPGAGGAGTAAGGAAAASTAAAAGAGEEDGKCPLPSPAPMLLYGYGSYGASMDMYFNASTLSFVDRGMVYAVAHIRGGSEMGRAWYEDEGKLMTKRNTFNDFIDSAEHLIASGWTQKGRICAQGASAGGLLMGVVMNERPDLWGAVLSQVGFVDVLATMSDDTIPLTVTEKEEWGDVHQEEAYNYIKTYSPIDNVKPQAYPKALLTAGLNDSRVAYWEVAKFAQRLRDIDTTGGHQVLVKCELEGGHFSFVDRYAYLRDKAFDYAFAMDAVGVKV